MSGHDDITFDHGRASRIGLPEAVYAEGKSPDHLRALILDAVGAGNPLLVTRLHADVHDGLGADVTAALDFDPRSGTAFVHPPPVEGPERVAVVTAGTVDVRAAREAARTLAFHGVASRLVADVGVAGLWRLLDRADEIASFPVVIAVAGMEGALFSVLAGLVPGVMIAVPTSHGYGVAEKGQLALHAALSSCSPGVVVCNIDNGYGAACAALRVLRVAG